MGLCLVLGQLGKNKFLTKIYKIQKFHFVDPQSHIKITCKRKKYIFIDYTSIYTDKYQVR